MGIEDVRKWQRLGRGLGPQCFTFFFRETFHPYFRLISCLTLTTRISIEASFRTELQEHSVPSLRKVGLRKIKKRCK
jgi:hypothetical protein